MVNFLAANAGTAVLAVFLAIIILLAMITVHEFGHYISGKILGFKINEFAIGFGPALFKKKSKKSGQIFSVRAFPLGGFCAFEGEDGAEEEEAHATEANDKKQPLPFTAQKPWKRIIVLVSGALMNYLLALLLIIVGFFSFGQPAYKIESVQASEDYAVQYSLCAGDVILAAEGRTAYLATDLISALKGKKQGDTASLRVLRGGKEEEISIILRSDCNFENSSQTGKIWRAFGVGTHEEEDGLYWDITSENCRFGFFETLGRSFGYSFRMAGTIFKVLGELLTGNLGIGAMGGPITTIKVTGQMAVQGFQSFLQVAAYIGVNLAVFNLLPIPALDGSKVVFCLIEWVFRKPVPRKVEAIIHAVGLVLILGFAILVDILQFAKC